MALILASQSLARRMFSRNCIMLMPGRLKMSSSAMRLACRRSSCWTCFCVKAFMAALLVQGADCVENPEALGVHAVLKRVGGDLLHQAAALGVEARLQQLAEGERHLHLLAGL